MALDNDINIIVEDVINETCNKSKSEKQRLKNGIVCLINLMILFFSYVNCCKRNNIIIVENGTIT